MKIFLIECIVLVIGIFLATRIHKRHYVGTNGKLFKAWHIGLPGYDTYYCPEQTVELEGWVGTHEPGLKGIVNGQENPEITAGLALKTWLYQDYGFRQLPDGHWSLFKPAETVRYFRIDAPYRVSRGVEVKT